MSDGIYSALAGSSAQMRLIDVIANNLANVNTAGYKRDRVSFEEQAANPPEPNGFDELLGRATVEGPSSVRVGGTYADMSPGAIHATGNPLDVALGDKGFLMVETPQGTRLTRDGRLAIDGDGRLVTQAGQPIVGDGGAIVFPAEMTELAITAEGEIFADSEYVGQLRVVDTPNGTPQKKGAGLWDPGGQGVVDVETPEVRQGFLEGSNVRPVSALVELIQAQRSFDANQQMIRAHRDMDKQSVSKVGAVR